MARYINPVPQYRDIRTNDVLTGGSLEFLTVGGTSSTDRIDLFSDSAETVPLSNPVILDDFGRAPQLFFAGSARVICRSRPLPPETDPTKGVLQFNREPVGGEDSGFGSEWDPITTYFIGDVVREGGTYFISESNDNIGNQPSTDSGTNWLQWPAGQGNGALVFISLDQSIPNNMQTIVNFTDESYDTDGIHDNIVNNSRLTVPSGTSRVSITSGISFDPSAAGDRSLSVLMNAGNFDGRPKLRFPAPDSNALLNVSSPIVDVIPGDFFEVVVLQASGGALDLNGLAANTWFSMEIVQ